MKKLIQSVIFLILTVVIFAFSSCAQGVKKLSFVEVNGQKISCRMDMAEVLDAFKDEDYEYSESISCAYNGLDKIYDFTNLGFVVYTYPDGDKDFVLEVSVYSDEISQQGDKVKVSMSLEDLEALYGKDYTKEGDALTYTVKDEQTMSFLVVDGKVEEYTISVAE